MDVLDPASSPSVLPEVSSAAAPCPIPGERFAPEIDLHVQQCSISEFILPPEAP
jgi:hypothetical protein